MIDDDVVSARARALAAALEPVAGQVYFSPECHAGLRRRSASARARPRSVGSRCPTVRPTSAAAGSVLGQVPGEVVAAAFGVFNPAIVVPLVAFGWTLVTARRTICAARTAGAVGQLDARSSAPSPTDSAAPPSCCSAPNDPLRPEGRPLYAGLLGLGLPGDPVGDMWRLADRLREFRGDAHIAAWTSAGLRRHRDRPADRALLGPAAAHLLPHPGLERQRLRRRRGPPRGARARRRTARSPTPGGPPARTSSGSPTTLCRPIVEALGDDFEELVRLLGPWSAAVQAAGGYPGSGPHDLAGLTRDE